MTWYAAHAWDNEPPDDAQIWSVGRDPKRTGWCTDSGCDGYGLTRAEAEWLVAAANEKEKRDGRRGPWTKNRVRS